MEKTSRKTLRIYWQHAKKYWWIIALSLLGVVIFASMEIFMPLVLKEMINLMSESGVSDQTVSELFKLLWFFVALLGVNFIGGRLSTYTIIFYQPLIMRDLANTCFEYLHKHSYRFFVNNFAGSLVTKVRRFVRSFEKLADEIQWQILPLIIKSSFSVVVLWTLHPTISLMLLTWILFYLVATIIYSRFVLKYNILAAEIDSKVTGRLADTITNAFNIKVFSAHHREQKGFEKKTERQRFLQTFTWGLEMHRETVQALIMFSLNIAIIWVAINLWSQGKLTIGDFVVIESLLVNIFAQIWGLGRVIRHIYQVFADTQEMTEILETPHEIKDIHNAKTLKVTKGKIKFENVTFRYNKTRTILKKFNLEIEPGQKVALVGPSGAGKSTITKLLFRFFDIDEGEILIDDQRIDKVTQSSLRKSLSYVPQEPILFHRPIKENIKYGNPKSTQKDVEKAAKLAHSHEFIKEFSDGYNTFVGERGVKLSGGERQRVAIARAILEDAPILVLDEATSSLDSESESYIQDALDNLMKGRTTIVIAHRLSTIMKMDRILVIDEGKVIEDGTHEELLKNKKGVYQKLWKLQAGGFIK